jgi:hypothetical protein
LEFIASVERMLKGKYERKKLRSLRFFAATKRGGEVMRSSPTSDEPVRIVLGTELIGKA